MNYSNREPARTEQRTAARESDYRGEFLHCKLSHRKKATPHYAVADRKLVAKPLNSHSRPLKNVTKLPDPPGFTWQLQMQKKSPQRGLHCHYSA
jgi:hypothetical protein